MQAGVDQRFHFDNIATSCIEGYHAKIKKYFDFSIKDLKSVYKSLELY